MPRLLTALAIAALVLSAAPASALAEQAILGKKLQIKNPDGDPASRTIRGAAREKGSAATVLGDPSADGATLEIVVNGAGASDETFDLPADGWTKSSKGFRFSGAGHDTAVSKASIERTGGGTFQIKITLDGRAGDIDSVPANPTDDGGFILTIPGGGSYCVAFGGEAGGREGADDEEQWSIKDPAQAGCPLTPHRLDVTSSGNGVVTSSPAGIDCGSDCSEVYGADTEVTLTPAAGEGYRFGAWSGDCSGSGECTVSMDEDRQVGASFEPIPFYRLSVTRFGSGTVSSTPAGIDCGGDCIEDYEDETPVTLEAVAADGYSFSSWGGDCSGSASCEVTMDAARNVTATFESTTAGCTNGEPTLVLAPAPAPGPAVMYEDAPDVPQLQNRNARFHAAPLLVSGHEAYAAGEYLYQDYVQDDFGAETSGLPYTTGIVSSPVTGTGAPDAAFYNTGDVTYPTNAARYGNNAADLVELRIAPGPSDVAYRVTLNTLLADDTTMVAIAWNSDGATTGVSTLSRDPGVSVQGTDEVIYLWGTGGEHVRYNGNGTVAATTPLAVTTDVEANQMTTFVPRAVHNPTGTAWKYVAMTGLRDAATGAWLRPSWGATATTPGGAGPAQPRPCAVLDLNNHFAVADGIAGKTGELCHFLDTPCDTLQAIDLRGVNGAVPALAKYARAVNFDQLAAGTISTSVPASGTLVRIFPSRLETTPAEGRSNSAFSAPANDHVFFYGALQPYSVYVPTGYNSSQPAPLTWAEHSLLQFHWQYNGTDYVQEIGEKRGSLVVTPNSRATDGFYVGRNEYDHFEVWNDVRRHYNVDPSHSAMTGYSMGGYATYRFASLYPDLFGKAYSIVGPSGAGIWKGTGGASISLDKGDDWSTLTNWWLENVRNVPFFNMAMMTDELVPWPGTRQQNVGDVDATGEAQSFAGLGYRYTFQEFVTGEHLTLFVNDAYPAARDFLGSAEVDPDPAHVTFSYVPESDRADLTLVHDHAYWVSGLTLRDAAGTPTASGSKSAKGTVDAYSLGFGLADPVASAALPMPGVLTGGNTAPLAYTQYATTWAAPAPIASANTLHLALANLRSVQIDVARAALDAGTPLVLETTSDGDTTVDLYGNFDADTAIYEDGIRLCAGAGALVGSVGARVPVAAGEHVYSLRVP